jgi:hypothetical protein
MSGEESSPEPKIIVDDDWKSQVEREKAEFRSRATQPESSRALEEMPPASLVTLLSSLATQAMLSLGLIRDPIDGAVHIHKPMAKHFIDTIAVLEDKTKGNLTPEEAAMLSDVLHQLRMAYVQTPDGPPPVAETPGKSSPIELA